MPTDEERIEALRAMSPAELNVYVAMNLGTLTHNQEECNRSCQARLDLMEAEVEKANKLARDAMLEAARLKGWFKGMWAVVLCLLGAVIAGTIALVKR